MTEMPERIWATWIAQWWQRPKEKGLTEYIRADLHEQQVAALTKEQAEVTHNQTREYLKKIDEINALTAENKRLREVLRRYGDHDGSCPSYRDGQCCQCGFSNALENKSKIVFERYVIDGDKMSIERPSSALERKEGVVRHQRLIARVEDVAQALRLLSVECSDDNDALAREADALRDSFQTRAISLRKISMSTPQQLGTPTK